MTIEGTPTAQPISGGDPAFSDFEVTFTYANGVRHTVKTTHDDNIFGGIVKENGHRSAPVCHLGVLPLRLGRKLEWNPEREKFTGEGAKDANKMIARKMRKPYDYGFV